MLTNLLRVFDAADKEDIEAAKHMWFELNRLVVKIAKNYEYTPATGAAVLAALSPNSSYPGSMHAADRLLHDTNRLLCAARSSASLGSFKVSTASHNKLKAWCIAGGASHAVLNTVPRTKNLFRNVLDPNDPFPVTVDCHVYSAWRGVNVPLNSSAQLNSTRLYCTVAGCIREVGWKKGVTPNVVQGIVWRTWRKMHGISTPVQLELWNLV